MASVQHARVDKEVPCIFSDTEHAMTRSTLMSCYNENQLLTFAVSSSLRELPCSQYVSQELQSPDGNDRTHFENISLCLHNILST